jgi:hypothetical protein
MGRKLHRHSSEGWNLTAFSIAEKKNGIPAFAGMTKVAAWLREAPAFAGAMVRS